MNCKTVTIIFYLLTIQLTVFNRTITRFIADDKIIVYQRVRREMGIKLDSDNMQLSTTSFESCEEFSTREVGNPINFSALVTPTSVVTMAVHYETFTYLCTVFGHTR